MLKLVTSNLNLIQCVHQFCQISCFHYKVTILLRTINIIGSFFFILPNNVPGYDSGIFFLFYMIVATRGHWSSQRNLNAIMNFFCHGFFYTNHETPSWKSKQVFHYLNTYSYLFSILDSTCTYIMYLYINLCTYRLNADKYLLSNLILLFSN